jgi:hypothetical protein
VKNMNKKQTLSVILFSLLALMAVPAVLAHTHVEQGNGDCQNIPGAEDVGQATGAHFGLGVAKGSTWGPFSHSPGNSDFDDYPGDADSALEGGWCD